MIAHPRAISLGNDICMTPDFLIECSGSFDRASAGLGAIYDFARPAPFSETNNSHLTPSDVDTYPLGKQKRRGQQGTRKGGRLQCNVECAHARQVPADGAMREKQV
jgi:hypothetical protein